MEATSQLREQLKKLSGYLYELPKGAQPGMHVPALVFITRKLLDDIAQDRSLQQLVNITMLPGVVHAALAMPDMHEGYGFPIGGVIATEMPHGVISPGGIGFDICCGVRLLISDLTTKDLRPHIERLASEIMRAVPSGTGRGGRIKLKRNELDAVLREGVEWCIQKGMASREDAEMIEEHGKMTGADSTAVSDRAKDRGSDQLGTLGSGNHFLEIERVDEIFEPEVAKVFGLFRDQVVIQIHCGSRGLGHQVCTDYVKLMLEHTSEYGISLPDDQLACAPADSPEGRRYLSAMACAANFAWANRQVITHHVRIEFEKLMGSSHPLKLLYDVSHNMGKIEKHIINEKEKTLLVHRKGATRAFGPGRNEVPARYRSVGQPVLIPGTMGTASYVLCGTELAMERSFGTVCHGAGRRMSRMAAKKMVSGKQLREQLLEQGIVVRCFSDRGLAEEAPTAYKDVEQVVDVVYQAGLAKKVARLRPIAVIKGE